MSPKSIPVRLINKGDKSFCMPHVLLVSRAKITQACYLIALGSGKEKDRGCHNKAASNPGDIFEKNSPGKEKQRAIHRMANVAINTTRHKSGGLFDADQ